MSSHTHEHIYACMNICVEWGVQRVRREVGEGRRDHSLGEGCWGEGLEGDVEGDGGCMESNNSVVPKRLHLFFPAQRPAPVG